jgi:aminopeptidase-like protein
LVSCHACHPSLCNDNLSGVAVATFLAKALQSRPLRYSCRILFIPGTIGSITWLARNEAQVGRVKHGFVITGVGDRGAYTYKRSRKGGAEVDRAFAHVLKYSNADHRIIDFFPYGYDERQYCSPGFNLPVGCFMRTPHGQYAEYHTSADNLHFVQPEPLAGSLDQCLSVVNVIQNNRRYVSQNQKCEPQLGKRGLYRPVGGHKDGPSSELAMLWVLNLSDETHSLLDIAERSGMSFDMILQAAETLKNHGLMREHGA